MHATSLNLTVVGTRSRVDGGNALVGAHLNPLVGRGGTESVCLRIDWPKDDVEFPVNIRVRNRSGIEKILARSIIWVRRLRIIGDTGREMPVKQTPGKRFRSFQARQPCHHAPASTSCSSAEVASQYLKPRFDTWL
jgi:hypothetical protein